jgi:hypothetical protein
MNRSSKTSGLLCLAAAIVLITGGRVAAEIPDTDVKCVLGGCRVVGGGEDYWCCCKTSTGEDCDTIRPGAQRPTTVSPQGPASNQPGRSQPLSPGGLRR